VSPSEYNFKYILCFIARFTCPVLCYGETTYQTEALGRYAVATNTCRYMHSDHLYKQQPCILDH
jgi:hypothetical protein